jgi:hypothetical protein
MITIHPSQLSIENSRAKISALIEFGGKKIPLWYSVENAYGSYLTPGQQDAFLVAMLPLALLRGEDVRVEGVLSEKLFYNLSQHLTKILLLMYPRLKPVKISAARLDPTPVRAGHGGVATGFTGGIDSSAVLAEHFFGNPPSGFRVTHCIFNNVGSHGRDLASATTVFEKRASQVAPLVQGWGLPFVTINSNLHELISTEDQLNDLEYVRTHTLRNASGALVLQKLFGKYLYASAYSYEHCRVHDVDTMGYSDPFAVHLLSTETMECISTGCQYTRTQKTALVTEIPDSGRYLCVCTARHAPFNCSVCKKCARTMLTLEILGKLDMYSGVFDQAKYQKVRNRFIANVLARKDPLSDEIVQLAKEKNYKFPGWLWWVTQCGFKNALPGRKTLK